MAKFFFVPQTVDQVYTTAVIYIGRLVMETALTWASKIFTGHVHD